MSFLNTLSAIITAIAAFLVIVAVVVYGIGLVIGGLLLAVFTAFLAAVMSLTGLSTRLSAIRMIVEQKGLWIRR